MNNAGYGLYGKMMQQDIDQMLGIIDVDIRALTSLGHHYASSMQSKGGGRIPCSLNSSFQPGPGMAVYCASKAFVLSLSRT